MKSCIRVCCIIILLLISIESFSQSVITVNGGKESDKNQIQTYLNYLGVNEPLHLMVNYTSHMPKRFKGITYYQQSIGGVQMISIWIDSRLTQTRSRLVLAHEMIHVKQYIKKELVLKQTKVFWKCREFCYQAEDNLRTPWELEAYHLESQLAKINAEEIPPQTSEQAPAPLSASPQ